MLAVTSTQSITVIILTSTTPSGAAAVVERPGPPEAGTPRARAFVLGGRPRADDATEEAIGHERQAGPEAGADDEAAREEVDGEAGPGEDEAEAIRIAPALGREPARQGSAGRAGRVNGQAGRTSVEKRRTGPDAFVLTFSN